MFDEVGFRLDARHVTHVGGKGEYLHDWYAYLEGYSSEFVREVRRAYLRDANSVIDPFAGVGTTPLTLALDGVECLYCELNPAMRLVINTKLNIASLPRTKKLAMEKQLIGLADQLSELVENCIESHDLAEAYERAFRQSTFFQPDAFKSVLKLRTLNDTLNKRDPLLGSSLQVAVMSKLVECSLLKRAGDVRYKTEKEVAKGIPSLIDSVVLQLRRMASDCAACPDSAIAARLLAPNAKDLLRLEPNNADGVITSPPYLNGTNYFRNTKLELWYCRKIVSEKCLRGFRDDVVTSGINDVTKQKGNSVLPQVAEVFQELDEKAYDKRIARMAAGYFEEMGLVLKGLAHQVRDGGRFCIDIGDSIYAGVHVPTHEILSEIAMDCGLKKLEIVTLRQRRSYNGETLTQSLIVLEKGGRKKNRGGRRVTAKVASTDGWEHKWNVFKETLPHMRHPYSKRNWGNALHSVCSYQGKMKPALAYHLVEAFSNAGDVVLDPFSGSGTIPFEAALNGRKAVGFDIGVLAVAVSNAKLKLPSKDDVQALLSELRGYLTKAKPSAKSKQDAAEVAFNKSISSYFHEDTFREILCARDFFLRDRRPDDAAWSLVFSSMLHILHGNRPYALSRRSHPLTPYAPTGEFIYKSVNELLAKKVMRSLEVDRGEQFQPSTCFTADILQDWPLSTDVVDAIITSPPFFDSTRFYMTNWMRYWFCGWGKEEFSVEPKLFIEEKQKKSLAVYDAIFSKCADHLRLGGVAVFHLGHSDKCDMANELLPFAQKHLKVKDVFVETVEHCESHGVSDKGRVKGHQYLVLER